MLFMIGYVVAEGMKGAGRKISSLTARHSGCSAYMEDDGEHYTLSYIGPKDHIESAWINCGSARNEVVSLEYDSRVFKAVARCWRDSLDRIIEEKTFEASTVRQLAKDIEQQFKEWDIKNGSGYLWAHH